MRHRHRVAALAAALTVMTTAWAGTPAHAQEPSEPPPSKTTTEKIKEKVGGAVDSVKRGAASAGEAVRQKYLAARQSVVRMGVEARVYARIHWDRELNADAIELAAPKTGTIILNGTVTQESHRARAVALARDTLGVDEVVDKLTVQPRPAAEPTGPKP